MDQIIRRMALETKFGSWGMRFESPWPTSRTTLQRAESQMIRSKVQFNKLRLTWYSEKVYQVSEVSTRVKTSQYIWAQITLRRKKFSTSVLIQNK